MSFVNAIFNLVSFGLFSGFNLDAAIWVKLAQLVTNWIF